VIDVTEVSGHTTIHQLVQMDPRVQTVMLELGFSLIIRPVMLQTVGRTMTLKKGCSFRNIDYSLAKAAMLEIGIMIKEDI
jgi:hypothetical protein